MIRAPLLVLVGGWALAARPTSLPNSHVTFEVKQKGAPAARWQLWTDGARAHLSSPTGNEVFYDLTHERRLDLKNGRSRDEPIRFGKMISREELFPRGVKLKRAGKGKQLGRSCQKWKHEQKEQTSDGTRRVRSSWCVWNGIPLAMEFDEAVCNRKKKCINAKTKWTATELTLGAAKATDFPRAPSAR